MGTKLQIVLCVLLLSTLGSAILSEEPAAPSSPTEEAHDLGEPGVPPASSENPPSSSSPESAGSESLPSQDSTSLAVALSPEGSNTSTSSNNDNSSSALVTTNDNNNNTVIAVDMASVTPLVQHPTTVSPLDNQEDGGNATVMDLTAIPTSPVDDRNLTEQSPPQPPLPPADHHNTSTQTSPAPTTNAATTTITITTTTTTTTAATTTVHVSPTHSLHTTAPQHIPAHSPHSHTPPHTISPSRHPTHASTRHSTTHSPTPPPVKPHLTEATTVTSTQASSTTGALPDPQPPSATSPVATGDSGPGPQTSGPAHHDVPPSSPSTQAKAHADTPSQLNVGSDATMVHEAPTLDPLLAGLVSAFIVTAVIITLLLFLKLRRRDVRPQFHRLQDLPMDDMMEDTPLSMYSY